PALLGPVKRKRAGKCSDERSDLYRGAARLEAEPIGEHHAQTGNLRHREIDEDNSAPEHLDAERRVSQRDQQPCSERRPHDAPLCGPGAHRAASRSRASVSSYRPNKSFARSVPPTVYGSSSTRIFARSAIHSAARG